MSDIEILTYVSYIGVNEVCNGVVKSINIQDRLTSTSLQVQASIFIDATVGAKLCVSLNPNNVKKQGDVGYFIGCDAKDIFGEENAPDRAVPNEFNAADFKKITTDIIHLADLVIFRDHISLNQYKTFDKHNLNCYALIDPSFFACAFYKSSQLENRTENYIAVNFRDISITSGNIGEINNPSELFFHKVLETLIIESEHDIRLIPMHTFFAGGDDRELLDKLAKGFPDFVSVVHNPISLEDTMNLYYNAKYCIGMRFYSILLQTLLNGNNYIIDYTHPQNGKINGLLKELNLYDFYSDRYYSLYNAPSDFNLISDVKRSNIGADKIVEFENQYVQYLKKLLYNEYSLDN